MSLMRSSQSRLIVFKLRGKENVNGVLGLHVFAYNLIRLRNNLLAQPSPQEWLVMKAT
jgi:hypothetical protein